ncbi:MAG: hypothetical protein DYH00_08530 [Bacteroidetes bacterium CHB6]|nr:hypothetical protein [Bacteroidetes bacterium CHB6]
MRCGIIFFTGIKCCCIYFRYYRFCFFNFCFDRLSGCFYLFFYFFLLFFIFNSGCFFCFLCCVILLFHFSGRLCLWLHLRVF